jgi:hypothetical protein
MGHLACIAGAGAGGINDACVFGPRGVDSGGGQRRFLAPDAFDLAQPVVGIEFRHGENLVGG